jgi:hypothetical protein
MAAVSGSECRTLILTVNTQHSCQTACLLPEEPANDSAHARTAEKAKRISKFELSLESD